MHEHEHNHNHEHHHDHDHGCTCECCSKDYSDLHSHGRENFVHEHKRELRFLVIGAVLFIIALVLEHVGSPYLAPVCIAAYLILGRNVLLTARNNILHGKIFDENFLMTIATLAAFVIGEFPEAVGVMMFYNIGELFEEISVEKSRERIAKAVDMRPETVNLIHGDHTHEVPAEGVEAGSLILIKAGERIPLDGRVVSGEGTVDTAPVTGEPVPLYAKAGEPILSGCILMKGELRFEVTAPLEESMVTKILNSIENATDNKLKIEKFITKFARIYTPIICALAVLVAVIPPLIMGYTWKHAVMTAVTFLVISCPCAMVISVPLAFFLGVGAASKAGILVKSSKILEALRKIKVVAMDKTGTITKGVVEEGAVYGDALKEDAKAGVAELVKLGIVPAMLTGDRKERAFEIAGEVGIENENVRCELLPDEKLETLWALKDKYGEIMFVGDGINDAPVLAGAYVGAAMGSGADAAVENADIVFMNSNVKAIADVIKIAGRTGFIAKENIVIALAIKAIVIILGLIGFANIWLAVFADTGVTMLCILNSLRLLRN